MIATILPASSNFHAVIYNERKVAKGTARLIEMKNFGFLGDTDTFGKPTPEQLRDYLEVYSSRNGRIRNTQFHLAISCKGREMSEQELLDFAHEYLAEMGYGSEGQPLLVYAHRDTVNNHIHIVTSRVAPDGTKINDSKERIRSQKAIDKILGRNASEKAKRDFEKAKGYSFSSMAQFKAILTSMGYESYIKEDTLYIKRQGVVQLKVNAFDFEPLFRRNSLSIGEIRKIQAWLIKYRDINTDVKGLQADLKKNFGLDIVFFGKKDAPYGYIIVDHREKRVIHGGRILKMDQLLDFATPEERIERIDALIDSILATNPKADTFAINKLLFKSRAYVKRGVLYHNNRAVRELNPIIAATILRNDKIARIEEFRPVTQSELRRLCKIYKVDREDLVSLSAIRKGNALSAMEELKEIFDNPETINVRRAIRDAGFQIHRSDEGEIFAVDFSRHVIIDLGAAGFDLSRLEYRPVNRQTNRQAQTVTKTNAAKPTKHIDGIKPLQDAGGGSKEANREWEVGNRKGYDDVDNGHSLKMI